MLDLAMLKNAKKILDPDAEADDFLDLIASFPQIHLR